MYRDSFGVLKIVSKIYFALRFEILPFYFSGILYDCACFGIGSSNEFIVTWIDQSICTVKLFYCFAKGYTKDRMIEFRLWEESFQLVLPVVR